MFTEKNPISTLPKNYGNWSRGKYFFQLKEKKLEIEALNAAEKAAQYVARSSEIEARLVVLERIATDQPTALAREIDLLAIDKGGRA